MILELDGLSVFASDGGVAFDPARPSVVLVHGVGMDHTVWGQQTRYLAHHGFNVLAVDLPGHGKTGGTPLDSIDAMSDWLARFIDAAGAAPAIVVGHSMGALIALQTAAAHPGAVRAIGLFGVSARMGVHPDLLQAADENRILAPELMSAWGHGPRAHRGGNIASGVWLIGGAVRLLERARPGLIASGLRACAAYKGAEDAARAASCPAMVVIGPYDKMTPGKAAGPLVAALGDVAVETLPEAGHMMMLEAPDAARKALYGFCRKVIAA